MIKKAAGALIAAACAFVAPAFADEAPPPSTAHQHQLDDLKATLMRIREEAPLPKAPADAGALVTLAKRQLRAWVELQLPSTNSVDVDPLNARLNEELRTSGLAGSSSCSNPDGGPPESRRTEACGYVGDVQLRATEAGRDGHFLTLTTSFDNAWCGVDGSAYLFRNRGGHWDLVWENEEDAESATYAPAPVSRVVVARRFNPDGQPEAPPPLVLTLSGALGCQGTWGAVRYRLWRVRDHELAPPPLLSRQDGFWIGNDQFIEGQLLPDDLLVEYRNRSVDDGVHNRTFISHYRISDDDKVKRVPPVALNPRDFVDEWLTQPWPDASAWTEHQFIGRMRAVHQQVPNKAWDGFVAGTFDGPPRRCRSDPTLWQVGFAPSHGKDFSEGSTLYFVVRWMAPYRFAMVDVTSKPRPHCDVVDLMPDATDTLFSVTGSPWPTGNPFAPEQ